MQPLDYASPKPRKSRLASFAFVMSVLAIPASIFMPWMVFGDIPKWRTYWVSHWISEHQRDFFIGLAVHLTSILLAIFALRSTIKTDSRGRERAIAALVISGVCAILLIALFLLG